MAGFITHLPIEPHNEGNVYRNLKYDSSAKIPIHQHEHSKKNRRENLAGHRSRRKKGVATSRSHSLSLSLIPRPTPNPNPTALPQGQRRALLCSDPPRSAQEQKRRNESR